MYTVLTMHKDAQIVLYLYGPAASGKTMFANFMCALIGRDRVVHITLKNLNTDRFKLYNLRDKALICIADAERYEADSSVIKRIVGSDPLSANAKYVQGSLPISHVGNLMIVSKHLFKSKDNTAALARRLLPFSVEPRKVQGEMKVQPQRPLLTPNGFDFVGPGNLELPGILN
jgi:phage/plasmid-associated DNA primase